MSQPSGPSPVRAAFAGVLRALTIFVAAVTVLGAGIGLLVGGTPGLWGGLMGAAVAAFFSLTTALIMVRTADRPMHVMNAWVVGAWLAKMLVLLVVLAVLKDATYFHKGVFFAVLVVAILGSTALEMVQLQRARIPVVDLTQSPRADDGAGPDAT
ncbi:hypothetical protein [Sanguibacter sp. HDW7]|uniref:hypothetical protein n=1 Tax=Sanguibacter sp. HDW7 TaxID=2714931 RepID=UPI001407A861|nr:hypothetical protein [Sanguibacter sp. HDW7]QIK84000.1 hypothetical protein G7063_10495 [Sanguibacter sp. HDW7]